MKKEKENNSGSGETAPLLLARAGLDGTGRIAIATAYALTVPNWQEIAQGDLQREASGFAQEVTLAVSAPEGLSFQKRVERVVDKVIDASDVSRLVITALLIEELTLDKTEAGASSLRIMENLEIDKEMTKEQAAEIFHLALKGRDGKKNPLLGRLKKVIGKSKIPPSQDEEKAKAEADARNLMRRIMRLQKEIIESYLPLGTYKMGESDSRLVDFLNHLEKFYSREDETGKLARENISLQSLYLFAEERLQYFSSKFPEKRSASDQPDKTEKEYWATVEANLERLMESQPPPKNN